MHIVFGDYSRSRLIESTSPNIPKENIISFNDDLIIGPIGDLSCDFGRLNRVKWFTRIFQDTSYDFDIFTSSVKKDHQYIQQLINNTDEIKELHIWTGTTSIDILSTARLLHNLSNSTFKIHLTDFSNLKLLSARGHYFTPKSLIAVDPDNVEKVAETFHLITDKELKKYSNLWKIANNRTEVIRVLDKNQKFKFVDECHFDQYLLMFCTAEYQKPARIIAQVLFEIDFAVSDSFLNWRLKELTRVGTLSSEGELRDMRDYKVKLASG